MNYKKTILLAALIAAGVGVPAQKAGEYYITNPFSGVIATTAENQAEISIEKNEVTEVGMQEDQSAELVDTGVDMAVVDIYSINVPGYTGFKSYMSYKALTCKTSAQYELQKLCKTNTENGIRMYEDRYCVAVGTGANVTVGTYIDLVLENGETIPCIVADIKAACDTESTNTMTKNGCASEIIVDIVQLESEPKHSGDMSDVCEEWQSPVAYYLIYDYNVLGNY